MRNLQKNTNAVSCFTFRVLARAVFERFYNRQSVRNRSMRADSFNVYHRSDTAVVVLKLPGIQRVIHQFLSLAVAL